MRRLVPVLILAVAVVLAAGCQRRQANSPDARVDAEIAKVGGAEAVARSLDRIKANPTAENYDLLARAYAKLKRPKQAREALEKAVSLDPTYAPASLLYARVLMDDSKYDQAEPLIQRVLQRDANDARAQELLARLLMAQNRVKEAEPMLASGVKEHGDDAALLWAYGDALTILKQYDEAEKQYKRAVKLDPKNVRIRMSYTQMLLYALKYDQVPEQAREVAKMAPDSDEMQFMAGSALHQAGKEDEAITHYREALIINPNNLPAANNIALLLADRKQDTGTAVAWARKAAALAPKNPAVVDTLGWALVRDGNVKEGLDVLRAVNKAWPSNAIIQYHLGWTLVKAGQKAEGMALLQKAATSGRPDAVDLAKKAIAELS